MKFIVLSQGCALGMVLLPIIVPFQKLFVVAVYLTLIKSNAVRVDKMFWVYYTIDDMLIDQPAILCYSRLPWCVLCPQSGAHDCLQVLLGVRHLVIFLLTIFNNYNLELILFVVQHFCLTFQPILIMVKVTRFISQHLGQVLKPFLFNNNQRMPPLDRHLSTYFRSHKTLGPAQRRQIYDVAYDLIRYHFYLNHLCKGSKDLDYRIQLLHSSDFYTQMGNEKLAKWIRCSYSKLLYDKICGSVGSEYQAFQICKALNTRAPLTIRINPLKTTRVDFLKKISSYLKIDLEKTQVSPYGVIVPSNKNIVLHETQQFKAGHFEVQDEASQIAALQTKCRPGDIVLDYCSGSGGKSLAISHLLDGKGQLYLHDPRAKMLQNAKHRFQRAGIQNVQFHNDETNLQKTLTNKADWIILDVPCTGTGTLRRNPDLKLKFNQDMLKHNVLKQQEIFSRSLKYLKKNGKLVYITCSLLQEENESQIKKFTKQYNLEVVGNEILKTRTQRGKMDSMFAAVLKRKQIE